MFLHFMWGCFFLLDLGKNWDLISWHGSLTSILDYLLCALSYVNKVYKIHKQMKMYTHLLIINS